MLVGGAEQLTQFGVRAHTVVNPGIVNRPVAMVTGELGLRIRVLAPRILRVLRDRRDPDRVHAKRIEESFLDLQRDALEVAALIVHARIHVRPVQWSIVIWIPVVETVHQHAIEHLRLRIVPCQLVRFEHRLTVL